RAAAVAALQAAGEVLARACAPARGRVSPADAEAARAAFAQTVATIGDLAQDGAWSEERVERFAQGRGPASQLSRWAAAGADAIAARVRDAVSGIARRRCPSRLDRPIAIVLIDVGSSETLFFDYFFEEEIFCDELGPAGLEG
ncbi:MAG: hypothetical protein AABZ30_08980, partial [Myxococcota bacterium]